MENSQVKPAVARLPLWWLWLVFSLLTVALGTWIRVTAAGWMLVSFGIVLCGFIVAHPIVHAIGALRAGRHRLAMPTLLLLSDLFFILGFGFQIDFSDAPGAYMGFQNFADQVLRGSTETSSVPEAAGNVYLGLALGFILALVASWVVIMMLALRKPKRKVAEGAVGRLSRGFSQTYSRPKDLQWRARSERFTRRPACESKTLPRSPLHLERGPCFGALSVGFQGRARRPRLRAARATGLTSRVRPAPCARQPRGRGVSSSKRRRSPARS